MFIKHFSKWAVASMVLAASSFEPSVSAAAPHLELHRGDHICYIGNTMADRMQHHAWLETYIHALHPRHELTFRNLGFAGDELKRRPRSANFGSPDQWLTKCKANVVFCFFGYNEALRGPAGLATFKGDLAELIDTMRSHKYNGSAAPRLVVFSPIATENLHNPNLPDGTENNRKLALYTDAMRKVCQSKDVLFVDVFAATIKLYAETAQPLTLNGIHLLDAGNYRLAKFIIGRLFPNTPLPGVSELTRLRQAVLDKNLYWFSRYRVVDGYNVYGGRSKLAWFGQSNADVMRREMEIFDIMTANRDRRVWAVAQGGDLVVKDDNIPKLLTVRTSKRGPLAGGRFPYLGAEEAIGKMHVADGMQVNVYASEEMFPRLVNPVQMAVDTNSRLWASVWPSYPHWNPTQPRKDALVILPDENGDGVADACIVFADQLNSITSFEFWGGGVLVAAPPEIWFLKDTDGDDRADVKLRVLQGLSSADTHHSANAMLIGPDGWLYWSRGIFNTANFETPTKTYRSGKSGVHRFNPRTFEVEFHFPIGPNPHGDVFDRWGYQFANDGTGGTGCYVDIGKGIGNKQWFKKRVRPVPAIGILSSSHFPEHNNGNFLICNAIGVLGVLQHEVRYNGADITAHEIEPILVSSDPNFRPSDLEIGGDGALYIADWQNALIGHMQHNIRDPNRDHTHGRIYRVTCKGRPLLKPAKMKGKPIADVCQNFLARENGTRYRARLELSGRDTPDVVAGVSAFAAALDPHHVSAKHDEAQGLLECLWTFEEHRVPNRGLVEKVFQAREPRVRAAAIRSLGHWSGRIEGWQPLLLAAARDVSPLVRVEAVKAAVSFQGPVAADVFFEVSIRSTDPELDTVLAYAGKQIDVEGAVRRGLRAGELSPAARMYVLRQGPVADLLKMDRSEAVYRAILGRSEASVDEISRALNGLATMTRKPRTTLLIEWMDQEPSPADRMVGRIAKLLSRLPASELQSVRGRLEDLALKGKTPAVRRLGYVAWIAASGPDDALLAALQRKDRLRLFLEAVPRLDAAAREHLYAKIRPLTSELPVGLKAEKRGSALNQRGIRVDYYYPYTPTNVAKETVAQATPVASGIVPQMTIDVPQRKESDRFALRFAGMLRAPKMGTYTFFTTSDDGSRLYIDGRMVVNNDGKHGMVSKRGSVELPAGAHRILVTYYDNGGGDGLVVEWQGPDFGKRNIAAGDLTVRGEETLHETAIRALASIPGHASDKVTVLAALIKSGKHRPAAIRALNAIPPAAWPRGEIRPLVDNLIGFLSGLPARDRTGGVATDAVALARSLASRLPADDARAVEDRLHNLDVRVIAIGTVPHRMIFDKEQIVAEASRPVEFRFSNSDAMPHNFSITRPGALAEVGELGEATGRDPGAMARNYVPESDKILLASRLLQPGEHQNISFDVPRQPGVYPYVCTYPGHWRRMHGALYVVRDLEAYLANPGAYLAINPLPVEDALLALDARNQDWKFEDLIADVRELPPGRSFEVGKQLFKVASCVACHQLDNEGQVFGPDLAKLDEKKHTTEHILQSMVDPSKAIDEKYQSYTFLLNSGKVATGMVVDETPTEIKIVVDPLAKDRPTVLRKDDIEQREKSSISLMPSGLLNKLTREEILDLIAFVYAGGDKTNALFAENHR